MKSRLRGRFSSRNPEESVNPMDGVANLADVMLILAVGIMLALVMHWNVDIGAVAHISDEKPGDGADNALILDSDSIEEVGGDTEQIDSDEMERLGTVYFDEVTGTYYIIVD